MTPIERAARALARDHSEESRWPEFIDTVEMVLVALREPCHGMTADVVPVGMDRTYAVEIWQSMVDAALAESDDALAPHRPEDWTPWWGEGLPHLKPKIQSVKNCHF